MTASYATVMWLLFVVPILMVGFYRRGKAAVHRELDPVMDSLEWENEELRGQVRALRIQQELAARMERR